jgi:hypothetical protein
MMDATMSHNRRNSKGFGGAASSLAERLASYEVEFVPVFR